MKTLTPEEEQSVIREAAALLGKLFVNRTDVKAVYRADHRGNWHWTAVREKYTMGDFTRHLTGQECLGVYLLTSASRCKFLAFDLDLSKDAKYWPVRYHPDLHLANEPCFELTMELAQGNLEAALHRPDDPGFPWARTILFEAVKDVIEQVRSRLGIYDTLTVITGGGAHVLVPLPELTRANEVRAAGFEVMSNVESAVRRNDVFWDYGGQNELSIEVFPKQDTLNGKDLGNLIRLPFGWHREAGIRTFGIDPDFPVTPVWNYMKIKSSARLRHLAQMVSA